MTVVSTSYVGDLRQWYRSSSKRRSDACPRADALDEDARWDGDDALFSGGFCKGFEALCECFTLIELSAVGWLEPRVELRRGLGA